MVFLTEIQPREIQNDALCAGQQRNCATSPWGAAGEKMFARAPRGPTRADGAITVNDGGNADGFACFGLRGGNLGSPAVPLSSASRESFENRGVHVVLKRTRRRHGDTDRRWKIKGCSVTSNCVRLSGLYWERFILQVLRYSNESS